MRGLDTVLSASAAGAPCILAIVLQTFLERRLEGLAREVYCNGQTRDSTVHVTILGQRRGAEQRSTLRLDQKPVAAVANWGTSTRSHTSKKINNGLPHSSARSAEHQQEKPSPRGRPDANSRQRHFLPTKQDRGPCRWQRLSQAQAWTKGVSLLCLRNAVTLTCAGRAHVEANRAAEDGPVLSPPSCPFRRLQTCLLQQAESLSLSSRAASSQRRQQDRCMPHA